MKVAPKEKLVLAGDLNGHVGESQIGFERWHVGFSVGEINEEGENILQPAQAFYLAIVNTFYSKRREHLLTYRSGGKATVIDYIMVRRENLRELKNCKGGKQARNGVGICVRDHQDKVLEVCRTSDKVMAVTIVHVVGQCMDNC